MARNKNCALYVTDSGKYCCTKKTICLKSSECAQIILANVGPVDLLQYATDDTDDATIVAATIEDGVTLHSGPGVFVLDLDCAELDGTVAPEDPAAHMIACCKVIDKSNLEGGLNLAVLAALEALCDKFIAANDATALAEILTAIMALCTKLETMIEGHSAILAELQALCKKLLAAIDKLDELCTKLDATNTQLSELCTKITALHEELVASIKELCTKLDTNNELLEKICTKLDLMNATLNTQLAAIVACLLGMKSEQIDQGLTLDEILKCLQDQKELQATIDQCCTGGATATTAKCTNVNKSWTEFDLEASGFDTCTASYGDIALPDGSYTYADFEAIILGVGGTIEPNPNNPDQYLVCLPDDFRTCFNRTCFKDRIGQITRICTVALPNTTEEECTGFLRTWGKYEEPIGNTLATSLDVQQQMLDKMCDLVDKQCLLLDAQTNPNACGSPVPEQGLDKEALTLTLLGDVGVQYPEGKTISLKNSGGDICGSATSTGTTSYDEETGLTTITIQECELAEGKVPAVITMAAPVLQLTATAVKNVVIKSSRG